MAGEFWGGSIEAQNGKLRQNVVLFVLDVCISGRLKNEKEKK